MNLCVQWHHRDVTLSINVRHGKKGNKENKTLAKNSKLSC